MYRRAIIMSLILLCSVMTLVRGGLVIMSLPDGIDRTDWGAVAALMSNVCPLVVFVPAWRRLPG